MTDAPKSCDPSGPARLAAFLRGETDARVFTHPIAHPTQPTGLCPCDAPVFKALWFYLKAGFLRFLLNQPYNGPKVWYLRRLGASIGNNVHISVGVYIDPLFPQLLTIEDNVLVGLEARIMLHEISMDAFMAGKVTLRRGCLIGGCSMLRAGVEVGEGASVAPASVVVRDVPPGATAIGSPARNVIKKKSDLSD